VKIATQEARELINGAPFATVTVEDEGIGFDARYADRIFQPFQRLHSRSKFEGTGMGLSICRRIVERHGGQIRAESVPGQGSRFSVTLPLEQVSPTELGSPHSLEFVLSGDSDIQAHDMRQM
jgi:signal transduction histidine kinase